jgi:hypothetical protein
MGEDFQELEATVGVEFTYLDVKDADPEDPSREISIQIWDTCMIKLYNSIFKISWS